MIAIVSVLAFTWACNDDETTPDGPSITAPEAADVLVGESTDITFSVTIPGGYKSTEIVVEGGTGVVASEPAAGATSGDVVVTFTSDAVAGDASIEITITDNNNKVNAEIASLSKGNQVTVTANITTNTTWKTGFSCVCVG